MVCISSQISSHHRSSAVIEEIKKTSHPLAYFYCDFREQRAIDGPTILRSLFVQLLRTASVDWMSHFSDIVQRQQEGLLPPADMDTLCNLLMRVSKLLDQPILVIDALDECKHVHELVRCLSRLGKDGQLGIFVTSRAEQIIVEEFRSVPSIALNDMLGFIQDDINAYIEKELSARKRFSKFSLDRKQEIRSTLGQKANGM